MTSFSVSLKCSIIKIKKEKLLDLSEILLNTSIEIEILVYLIPDG